MNTQSNKAQISQDTIRQYWKGARDLIYDLQPDQRFSTPELVAYLNKHLPAGCEQLSKTKVNYLRDQGILHPSPAGGEIRRSWRYTPEDAHKVLVVELLKTREDLNIQEIKWRLERFEESQITNNLITQAQQVDTEAKPVPTSPTPVNLAYSLLRNRVLGTLITVLSNRRTNITPPECFIAIRTCDYTIKDVVFHRLSSWEDIIQMLEVETWYLAVSDSSRKLYVYDNIEKLKKERPKVADMLSKYRWYTLTFQAIDDQFYEVLLGIPQWSLQELSIAAIEKAITQQIKRDSPINLSNFPGLSTLLRAAFVNQTKIDEGTTLSALIEIIAAASGAWDYCAVLVPKHSDNAEEKWLGVQEYSSNFPLSLLNKRIEIGRFLTGWCYRYCKDVIVEPTTKNDHRIAFFEEEGRPVAAAAIPAIADEQRIVGVIYVARRSQTEEKQLVFSEELRAGLKEFGYLCGDIIARDQIEIETVQGITQLSTYPLVTSFPSLEDLLQQVIDELQREISPESAPHSWIYILTLNIQATSQDVITKWLLQQGIEVASNFLAYHLWDPPRYNPLPVGLCEIEANQYVFAILTAVDLPEEKYKQGVNNLQQEMSQIRLLRLSPDFFPSAVTFRYEDLRQQLNNKGMKWLLTDLDERIRGALIAAPYIIRGHEAQREGDLDQAVLEFKAASNNVSNSWYVYKHLAEVYMLRGLRGTEKDLELAVESCQKALELNPDYASAHCLLADCMSYQGKFCEALIEYEKALNLNSTRRDFLIRYGFALAGMTTSQYQEAVRYLRQQQPTFFRERSYSSEPLQEAIKKFDQARNLSPVEETTEEQRVRRAEYHSQLGYAYLQAGYIDEALEDFAAARKLAPDNLQLEPVYRYTLSLLHKRANESPQ